MRRPALYAFAGRKQCESARLYASSSCLLNKKDCRRSTTPSNSENSAQMRWPWLWWRYVSWRRTAQSHWKPTGVSIEDRCCTKQRWIDLNRHGPDCFVIWAPLPAQQGTKSGSWSRYSASTRWRETFLSFCVGVTVETAGSSRMHEWKCLHWPASRSCCHAGPRRVLACRTPNYRWVSGPHSVGARSPVADLDNLGRVRTNIRYPDIEW